MESVTVLENEIIVSKEPDFQINSKENLRVQYFVLCKKGENIVGTKDAFELEIAGEKLFKWAERACPNSKVLEIFDSANELEAIKNNVSDCDYVAILYGNMPLLNKQHLIDLVNFVAQKNMNVCRLKKGYIIKTDYLDEIDEIFSADVYNYSSNDFFEVVNFQTLGFAKNEIEKMILSYHSKNGVNFLGGSVPEIDANVQIGYQSTISAGAKLKNATRVGEEFFVGNNSIIKKSRIGENVSVGDGAIIINSVIGSNISIGNGVIIENSTILNDCEIGLMSKILNSKIYQNSKIDALCEIANSNVFENSEINLGSKIYMKNLNPSSKTGFAQLIVGDLEEK